MLAGAYPAGILPGSLSAPGSPRAPACGAPPLIGLLVFAVSIVGFGFGTSIVTLDALRFLQGAGCGFIWGGGLTWVIAVAPRERRGEMLGSVIGAAIFGTLLGPILGIARRHSGHGPGVRARRRHPVRARRWTARHPDPVPQTPPARPVRRCATSRAARSSGSGPG